MPLWGEPPEEGQLLEREEDPPMAQRQLVGVVESLRLEARLLEAVEVLRLEVRLLEAVEARLLEA